MRIQGTDGTLRVRVFAGARVALIAMSLDEGDARGLLGFGIRRVDPRAGREVWLDNLRSFRSDDGALESLDAIDPATLAEDLEAHADEVVWDAPPVDDGGLEALPVSRHRSDEHPIQAFHWGDYTVAPGTAYTYEVVALYGRPGALERRHSVTVEVTTESVDEGTHRITFNRGAIAAQSYVRQFGETPPSKVGAAAWRWLSHGLFEAMKGFVESAKDGRYALRAAVYEFKHPEIVGAFAAALGRGVDVRIVYDAKEGEGKPGPATVEALAAAGIPDDVVTPRAQNPSFISHNKFIVLLRDGEPVAVWTGSTNVTPSGIFGQWNVGHAVWDRAVAKRYLAYWGELAEDPPAKSLRAWNDEHSPIADAPVFTLFSPRGSLEALDWYAQQMREAQHAVLFTAAFGVNERFVAEMDDRPEVLRYVLMEKDKGDVTVIERNPNNRASVGSAIGRGGGPWLDEIDPHRAGLGRNVFYIHTKFMVIDPFGDSPTVISGSANFSDASTVHNDENMLVMRGDTAVADAYLGEFMRLFAHYRFRRWVTSLRDKAPGELERLAWLSPDDSWTAEAYRPGSPAALERALFAGDPQPE